MVKVAVLGTSKATFSDESLPEVIRAALAGLPKTDAPGQLLHAAALMLLHEHAGRMPSEASAAAVATCPDADEPQASAAYAALLAELLAEKQADALLLREIWQKMREKGLAMPHKLLPEALEACLQQPGLRHARADLKAVLGARGHWLLGFHTPWAAMFQAPDEAERWAVGTHTQRQYTFTELRKSDPAEALSKLQTIWPTESATQRKGWLALLQEGFSARDVPFVETVLAELQQPTATKAVQQDTRRQCAQLLLALPGTGLFEDSVLSLSTYIRPGKTVLGLRGAPRLELPDAPDLFFNGATMSMQYGWDAKSGRQGVSDVEAWFCNMVSSLHPAAWERLVSPNWDAIWAFFEDAGTANDSKDFPLSQLLSQAVCATRYGTAARAFLKKYPVDTTNWMLLQMLDEEELATYLMGLSAEVIERPSPIRQVLRREGWVWPERLSVFVFKCLCKSEYAYHNAEFALELAPNFHLSILRDLEQMDAEEAYTWPQQEIKKRLVRPLLRRLSLRKKVTEL
jgi:hypothetical protein